MGYVYLCKLLNRLQTKISRMKKAQSLVLFNFLGCRTEKHEDHMEHTSNRAIQCGRREESCKQKDHIAAPHLPPTCPHPAATPSPEVVAPKKM